MEVDFDELGVAEVVELLDHANIEAVVRDFGDKNPREDPVIHFYESFLSEYDKQKKVERGVFYTPRPVVSYIVRSVDQLLRTEFGSGRWSRGRYQLGRDGEAPQEPHRSPRASRRIRISSKSSTRLRELALSWSKPSI